MLIRVPLLGSDDDPRGWYVDLPTYVMVSADYDRKVALVEVPDADVPNDPGLRAALGPPADVAAASRAPLAPPHKTAWRRHLDARYREHVGRWSPERA